MRFLFIFLILLAQRSYARNYSVIITGDDRGNRSQDNTFKELSKDAADLYGKRGYEVIFLKSDMRKGLATLVDVEDLHINIHTHGTLDPFSFVIDKDRTSEISLDELRESLLALRQRYPKMTTSIETMACYGGNVSRALRSIPGLIVFSASPADKKTTSVYDSGENRSLVYTKYLYEHLEEGMSFLGAHLRAKELDLAVKLRASYFPQFAKVKESFSSAPESSLESSFSDLCSGTLSERVKDSKELSVPSKQRIVAFLEASLKLEEDLSLTLLQNCQESGEFCQKVSAHLEQKRVLRRCLAKIQEIASSSDWHHFNDLFELGSRSLSNGSR